MLQTDATTKKTVGVSSWQFQDAQGNAIVVIPELHKVGITMNVEFDASITRDALASQLWELLQILLDAVEPGLPHA